MSVNFACLVVMQIMLTVIGLTLFCVICCVCMIPAWVMAIIYTLLKVGPVPCVCNIIMQVVNLRKAQPTMLAGGLGFCIL